MQNRPYLSPVQINGDLLQFVLKTPKRFWYVALPLGVLAMLGALGTALIVVFGQQVQGYNNTVYWAVPITNFIFWVGMSQAGILVTALLRLCRAEWRRPVTRISDSVSFFALVAAAVFPIIHTGRPWRTLYWVFPYDFTRQVWPNVRSALIWDPAAIVTYMIGTLFSIYLDLIPDMAIAREYASGWKRSFYNVLSLGWYGSEKQWKVHHIASLLIPSFLLPTFILIHSIVSWDLAMAIVPEWHDTLFAPYFIMDAIHSGVAAVATILVGMYWLLGVRGYIRKEHLDGVGRVLVATAAGWLCFNMIDFFMALFSRDPLATSIWELRTFTGPYEPLFMVYFFCGFLVPLPLLMVPKWRQTPALLFIASLLINVALWIERYFLVVTPLSFKGDFTFMWTTSYDWHATEYLITIGGFGLMAFGVVLFAKFFPIVPPWNMKGGQVVRRELAIGRARVAAALRTEHN